MLILVAGLSSWYLQHPFQRCLLHPAGLITQCLDVEEADLSANSKQWMS